MKYASTERAWTELSPRLNITFVSSSSSGGRILPTPATFGLNCYPSEWTIFDARGAVVEGGGEGKRRIGKIKTSGWKRRKRFLFRRVTDLWSAALFARVPFLESLHIYRANALLQFVLAVSNRTGYLSISRTKGNENEERRIVELYFALIKMVLSASLTYIYTILAKLENQIKRKTYNNFPEIKRIIFWQYRWRNTVDTSVRNA